MQYVSCAPEQTYRLGGFYDPAPLLSSLTDPSISPHDECQVVSEVFPAYSYQRPSPTVFGATAEFAGHLQASNDHLNSMFKTGAASLLTRIDNAFLYHNVIYTSSPAGFRALYETHRLCDRPHVPVIDWTVARHNSKDVPPGDVLNFFLGSVGTSNYGHWLVDDLPRAAAIQELARTANGRLLRIWITSAGERMDAVRGDCLQTLFGRLTRFEVVATAIHDILRFPLLYYVTPSSYHPILKSPQALAGIAKSVQEPEAVERPRRLFVNRRTDRGRTVANIVDIMPTLKANGFIEVDPEAMTFQEQMQSFSAAEVVVGCMGAAMTNCIFLKPGAFTAYFAPQGWIEPFYWDVAAVRGHQYMVCFGAVTDPSRAPHESSYVIDQKSLHAMLGHLPRPANV